MALKFTPKFSMVDIQKQIREKTEALESELIDRLQFVGETFVNSARNNGTYTDRTGNLRSSIGYVILKDGEQLSGNFEGKTETGKATGEKIALDASLKFQRGIVLIVVAGMEYAAAVESKNFDVLTASSITAENDLSESLAQMKISLSEK